MSVPEAVDNGYTVVFTTESVKIYDPEECLISGVPTLTGARDKRNRLFYISFPTPSSRDDFQCKVGTVDNKQMALTEYFREAHKRRWQRADAEGDA